MFERTGEPRNKKAHVAKATKEKAFSLYKLFAKLKQKKARERSSSKKEHKVNALASGADEGRDKLR